jgi:hypothetical protein
MTPDEKLHEAAQLANYGEQKPPTFKEIKKTAAQPPETRSTPRAAVRAPPPAARHTGGQLTPVRPYTPHARAPRAAQTTYDTRHPPTHVTRARARAHSHAHTHAHSCTPRAQLCSA